MLYINNFKFGEITVKLKLAHISKCYFVSSYPEFKLEDYEPSAGNIVAIFWVRGCWGRGGGRVTSKPTQCTTNHHLVSYIFKM
jgi:hypothetical protein